MVGGSFLWSKFLVDLQLGGFHVESEAIEFLEELYDLVPEGVGRQGVGVANNDETVLRSGQCYVDSAQIIQETYVPPGIAPDSGKDDDWFLTALPAIDRPHIEIDSVANLLLEVLLDLDCLSEVGRNEAVVVEVLEFLAQLRPLDNVLEKVYDQVCLAVVEERGAELVLALIRVEEKQRRIPVQKDWRRPHVVLRGYPALVDEVVRDPH